MLKLYRRDGSDFQYWEAWDAGNGTVVTHEGVVGQRGTDSAHKVPRRKKPDAFIGELAREPAKNGFAPLPEEDHAEMIVQFKTADSGTVDDLDFRSNVEGLLNETLGWTGNGHCDGGDIGSGTINVFSEVVVPAEAVAATRAALQERGWLDQAVIAVRNDHDYIVVWPPDYGRPFSY